MPPEDLIASAAIAIVVGVLFFGGLLFAVCAAMNASRVSRLEGD